LHKIFSHYFDGNSVQHFAYSAVFKIASVFLHFKHYMFEMLEIWSWYDFCVCSWEKNFCVQRCGSSVELKWKFCPKYLTVLKILVFIAGCILYKNVQYKTISIGFTYWMTVTLMHPKYTH